MISSKNRTNGAICAFFAGNHLQMLTGYSDDGLFSEVRRALLGSRLLSLTGAERMPKDDSDTKPATERCPMPLWTGGSVDPSFRALSGRLKCTVRRHKFNKDSLSPGRARHPICQGQWPQYQANGSNICRVLILCLPCAGHAHKGRSSGVLLHRCFLPRCTGQKWPHSYRNPR